MNAPEIRSLLDFAMDAAWEAGQLGLAHFQTGIASETKPDGSPVTVADRGIEALLHRRIAARFPRHRILGEELGETGGAAEARWILDPIDGTRAFVRGVPLFGVLIGLEWEGEMALGVAHFPALGVMVSAGRGLGCRWNGRAVRASAVTRLDEALLLASDAAELSRRRPESWRALTEATALFRGWGDCYGHCLVAAGQAEIMLDPVMSPWDCAALVPILREAGGTFTDWTGEPRIDGGDAFSTNGALFEAVRDLLAPRG
jgi:histidinol-phosphatase